MYSQRKGRVKPPQAQMWKRRARLVICFEAEAGYVWSKAKVKGKDEFILVRWMGWEVVTLLLTRFLRWFAVEWKLSSRLMSVMCIRVKIERESSVLISAYGPGSKKSEEDMEGVFQAYVCDSEDRAREFGVAISIWTG